MKRNLLTISALVLSMSSISAQVLSYVGDGAKFYVGQKALVYNGGGMKVKASGVVENHGNVMIVGQQNDVFVTVDASNSPKVDGGNFYNKLNGITGTMDYDNTHDNVGITYSYGQLYISGLTQANITGVVNEEYQRESHGDYQQIGVPFYDKSIVTGLSSDFGVTFNTQRWSEKEILKWNNRKVRFDLVGATDKTDNVGHNYYVIGAEGTGLKSTVASTKKDIIGRPNAEESVPNQTLKDAGLGYNFGSGGNAYNYFHEKYNSYLQDGFHLAAGGNAWEGDYGKNLYQYSNPFLTNIDLSNIARETGAKSDGVNISNVYGVRLESVGVTFNAVNGSESTSYKYITFNQANGSPVGDIAYAMVRPMGTFVIKLRDNNAATLDFKKLRRFEFQPRAEGISYDVTAAKNANFSSSSYTVKQLGIIGLDENGKEIARTYYVVTPSATTGYVPNNMANSIQFTAPSNAKLGSFEESVNGGYDENVWGDYWLYINEANEIDFQEKNIKVVSYDPNIKSFKFEIRENAQLVDDGTHALGQGIGFYYKDTNNQISEVKHNNVVSLNAYDSNNALEYDFYYGEPNAAILGVDESAIPSRTQVVYNPSLENYVILFDKNWKKADVKVYDLSGRLILSDKDVDASTVYEIKLQDNLKSGYVVDVVSDKGQKLTKKILK